MLHSDAVRERLEKRKRIIVDDKSGPGGEFGGQGQVIPPRGIAIEGSAFYTEDSICDTFNSIWNSGESKNLSDTLENISRCYNKNNPALFNK